MNETNQSFVPPTFEFNSFIESFTNVPRFGHSKDFALLFSNSTSDQIDYSLGTIFLSGILMGFFVLWMILFVLFMCCGPRKVGFLAGFRMKEPLVKQTASSLSPSRRGRRQPSSTSFRLPIYVRLVLILSALIVIAATVIPVFVFGFNDLKDVSDSTKQVGLSLSEIGSQGKTLTLQLTEVNGLNEIYKSKRDLAVNELRPDNFCAFAGLPDSLKDSMSAAQQALYDLDDFAQDEFVDLKNDLFLNVEVRGLQIESNVNRFGVRQWYLWFYLVTFAAIAFLMLVGTVFTWAGKPLTTLNCLLTWFFLPILLIMITIAWIVLCFLSIGAVMLGDFCKGDDQESGPDVTSMRIIQIIGNEFNNPIIYYVDSYVFGGCQTIPGVDSPLMFLSDHMELLDSAAEKVAAFAAEMDSYTLSALSASCGGKNFDGVRDLLDVLLYDYPIMKNITSEVQGLTACERLNPIYTDYVYEDACTEAPEGILWGWIFLFCLSFFGMILVTFRSAWLEVIKRNGSSGSPINGFEYDVLESPASGVSSGKRSSPLESSPNKSPNKANDNEMDDKGVKNIDKEQVDEEEENKMTFADDTDDSEVDLEEKLARIKSEQKELRSLDDYLNQFDDDDDKYSLNSSLGK